MRKKVTQKQSPNTQKKRSENPTQHISLFRPSTAKKMANCFSAFLNRLLLFLNVFSIRLFVSLSFSFSFRLKVEHYFLSVFTFPKKRKIESLLVEANL
jgi:hypothetical protein